METVKVWVSKYALSGGIQEFEVELKPAYPEMACPTDRQYMQNFHGEGHEWHRTKEGAIDKAEEMRLAKIKSLQKQIGKLEKLKFCP